MPYLVEAYAALATAMVALLLWKPALAGRTLQALRGRKPAGFGNAYDNRINEHVRRLWQMDRAVVFIGDSLVSGLAVSSIAPNSENLGIGGDTLERVIYRLERYDLSRARAVILAVGINNRHKRYAGFSATYARALALIPSHVPVIASAILPIDEWARNEAGVNALSREANHAIATACSARPRCVFVDPGLRMLGANGGLREGLATDGMHLSAEGFVLYGDALREALHANISGQS